MANSNFSRRAFLAVPGVAALVGGSVGSCGAAAKPWAKLLAGAEWQALAPDGSVLADVLLERQWNEGACTLKLRNGGQSAVRVGNVCVFRFAHGLSSETPMYAEGSQMLSQTAGSIGMPEDVGGYTDAKHYRLPTAEGAFTGYNLLHFDTPEAGSPLLAFTSCRRFGGKFQIGPERLDVVLDVDGLELGSGEAMELESFEVFEGRTLEEHYAALAAALRKAHPPIHGEKPPQGWCSWYCFGPSVTAEQVMANLEFIAREMPSLRYIQIDDGYQSAMGDWLDTGKAFGGDVRTVLQQIKARGFEPAIWVAPFIAEAGSQVFQQHPDWFMKGEDGKPLASNEVTFGGWRRGPWYALDGTNPEVQLHFENVFRTMREEWGVTYFKLDANFWGAMPQGRLYDKTATRIEAYRRGMEAVRRGAGDAFLLGCNHPLWPSLGLIHGSRSSNDISRRWRIFRQVARENLLRGWQNGTLWWNDPDVVLLTGDLSDDEFHFHVASIYASGGMLLAGDDLPQLSTARMGMLRKLSPPTGQAAVFGSDLAEGRLRQRDRELVFLFNWTEQAESRVVETRGAARATDFWTEENVEIPSGRLAVTLPLHGARILVLHPAKG